MAKLKWDQVGEKTYETGVDHGVLYPQKDGAYPVGVAWSGLTGVTESPSGAEDNDFYADNIKYASIKSAEQFGATIECYTYPDEWLACNGEAEVAPGVTLGQQRRNTFGFSYRTKIGNDTEGQDYAFKIHLVYGCSASPSEKSNPTINDSPEPSTLSYTITTTPIDVSGIDPVSGKPYKPVSHISFDSRKVPAEKMKMLEEILYGTNGSVSKAAVYSDGTDEGTVARLPMPEEIIEMFKEAETPEDPPLEEEQI